MRPWNPNTKSTGRPEELNPGSSDRPASDSKFKVLALVYCMVSLTSLSVTFSSHQCQWEGIGEAVNSCADINLLTYLLTYKVVYKLR